MPKEETFPIPLKYIDVTMSTHTDVNVMQERINDCWNVDSNREKFGRKLVKPFRIEKNKNGHKKKPKLDNARKLRGIYFIDPRTTENCQKFSTMKE